MAIDSSSGKHLLARIRKLAEDSTRVYFSQHARVRMRERGITVLQVLATLTKGIVTEPAHLNTHQEWQIGLKHKHAGDDIQVVAVLSESEQGEMVVVVTTYIAG